VSVTIDYLYHGVWYTVTIPAGADLDALEDSEGYYGFRYLDQVIWGKPVQSFTIICEKITDITATNGVRAQSIER